MRQKRQAGSGASSMWWLAVLPLVLIFGIGLAACGGGASDEEIAQAERQGAAKERQRQRLNELEKELKNGLKDLKRGGGGTKPVPVPNPPSTSAPSPPSEGNCGGTLSVNSVTTCEFAENVRAAYESEVGSGSGTVSAYSPAREVYYAMSCTAGPPHECTGGDGAAVYFP
jgi:cell division protein FtsB